MDEPEVDSRRTLKEGMQILCALGFGLLPVIGGARYASLINWFIPILLGLIFFVMWRHDVSKNLFPWLFVFAAVGHLGGNWFNSRHGHGGPIIDYYAWFFVALAVLLFLALRWESRKSQTHRSKPQDSTAA